MVHLVEARVVDEDWNAIAAKAERKKLQNRLNQRAHRRRKNQQDQPVPYSKTNEGAGVVIRQRFFKLSDTPIETPNKQQPAAQPATTVFVKSQLQIDLSIDSIRVPQCPEPYPVHILPLSADHQLLTLIHYNVYRGLFHNKLMVKNSTNFSCAYEPATTHIHAGHDLPPTLTPTIFQQTIPHQTWIDVFPSPTCRDNLILELSKGRVFDFIELFKDLHGVFTTGTEYFVDPEKPLMTGDRVDVPEMQPHDRRGFIVWGDAWNPTNWEVTEGFLDKWGWLLKGCKDLMAGTNQWRALRDEPPLYW